MRQLETVALSDAAQLERILAIARKGMPTICNALLNRDVAVKAERATILPRLADITSAQLTIFDNWQATGGRRPDRRRGEKGARAQRFKAQMDLWTCEPDVRLNKTSSAVRVTFHLMDQRERYTAIATYADPKRSKGGFATNSEDWQQFGDFLMTVGQDRLAGPGFVSAGTGTNFVLDCLAMIEAEDAMKRPADTQVVVSLGNGESVSFHSFSDTYAGRAPLEGNAVLSSRMSVGTHNAAWRTGVLYQQPVEANVCEVVQMPIAPAMTSADMPY